MGRSNYEYVPLSTGEGGGGGGGGRGHRKENWKNNIYYSMHLM